MSVQIYSPEELETKLKQLYNVLTSLPDTLPYSNQYYNFTTFSPDPEKVEEMELAGAVNNALEITFAPFGRMNGITLLERGPGLVSVVDVLRKHNQQFPRDAVLQKWVLDLMEAGIKAGGSVFSMDTIMPELRESEPKTVLVGKKRKNTRPGNDQPKKQLLMSSSVLNWFVDREWDELDSEKGKGGRKRNPLIESIAIPGYRKEDVDKTLLFRCTGASRGCDFIWNVNTGYRARFFTHAWVCEHLPSEIRHQAGASLGNKSLGKQLSTTVTTVPLPHVPSSSSTATPTPTPPPVSVQDLSRASGRAELNKKINFALLKLLCVRGLPPTIVDSKEWKDFVICASPHYQPVSSKTFVDSLFPSEAAYIKEQQVKLLQEYDALTISFDGGTTAALQSVYTVHVITPDRRAFLMEGSEASDRSHTGDHIFHVLDQVLMRIGPTRFKGITSDNTGNTSLARLKVRDAYPWIIILPDPCHRLNLLCKDIAKMGHFRQTVKDLQRTIQYFRKSTFATAQLKKKRNELGISRGIVSIGKTRFGTIYFAVSSLKKNYKAISELCQAKELTITDVNQNFMGGRSALEFEYGLRDLTTVLAPVAKTIACLESTHSTVSDVYLFWLAVTADIHDILIKEDISNTVKESIRRAVNYRFDQMVNNAPSDVYLCGFILDPRFRHADILRELNPLAIQKLKIPARDSSGKFLTDNTMQSQPVLPLPLRRAGTFLLSMLRAQYDNIKKPIAGLSKYDANVILKEQLLKYQKGVYPFDHPFRENDHASKWWKRLDRDQTNDAQPLARLATSLFGLLPNSMVDERTASTMKWFNSPLRNRQYVSTLVRTTVIRQWYRNNLENKPEPFRPTVRFRDMKQTIFGTSKKNEKKKSDTQKIHPAKADDETSNEDDEDDLEGNSSDAEMDRLDGEDDESKMEDSASFSGNDLEMGKNINLKSPLLLDLLADSERTSELLDAKEKGKGSVVHVEIAEPNVEPNIDMDKEEYWRM